MNREWVTQREAEHERATVEMRETIVSKIESSDLLTASDKEKMLGYLEEMEREECFINRIDLDLRLAAIRTRKDRYDDITKFRKDLDVDKYIGMIQSKGRYAGYLDSEPKEFDGDIIITDPCYVCKRRDESTRPKWGDYMKDSYGETEEDRQEAGFYDDYQKLQMAQAEWDKCNPDDWELSEYGYNMEALGVNTYMTRDTIYGDWSCTAYNTDTGDELGHFCADAGLVSVFLLEEILRYNPEFNYHKDRPWTTAWIPNFKGTVRFIVERQEGVYDEDTKWWKAGDKWEDYAVRVVGNGVNKLTGEPINFITSQTGL